MITGNIYFSRNLRKTLSIVLVGAISGLVYTLIADDWGDLRAYTVGVLIGISLGFIISMVEIHLFKPSKRPINFLLMALFKSVFYLALFTILVLVIKSLVDSLFLAYPFYEYLTGPELRQFIFEEDFYVILSYSLVLLSIIIFTLQVDRKMGQGILINFISGKYHNPKEEKRIFMFLDLKSSTTIAEKLGDLQYHTFLNSFFFDITKCIVAAEGEIYRYVGDEVVVSWKMKRGLRNANCIRTYFYAKNEIKKLREQYYKNFKLVPDFRAFFHYGTIVVGEIGEIKSQIVYHGETLYDLKVIEKKGSEWNHDLLISSELIQQLSIPVIYRMAKVGEITKKLSGNKLELYTLEEKQLQAY
jgi:adenylate cyclase